MNKVPVGTMEDIQAVLDPLKPGDRVTLTLSRGGSSREVTLPLVEVE